MSNADAIRAFERRFHRRPEVVAAAPGRVNIIGEHVDYVQGLVLPFAIDRQIVVAAAAGRGDQIATFSEAIGEQRVFAAGVDEPAGPGAWENYVRGMVAGLRTAGIAMGGAQLWIGGDLAPGSGLSSSAALCVAVGRALLGLAQRDLPGLQLAQLAQQAEHDFAGTPCGLMDQFVSVFGRAGQALLIDFRTLTHKYVPAKLPDHAYLAIPSGVKHALADGAYEQRVRACRAAAEALREEHPKVVTLRDASPEMLVAARDRLDATVLRRARHVVSELARVQAAVAALRAGDAVRLGALLRETHDSLRDDYEVSCPEVDELIALLDGLPGVRGARMVGGGFGGVVLATVEDAAVDAVAAALAARYYAPHRLADRAYVVQPADGAASWRC